jgi:acetyltransferase
VIVPAPAGEKLVLESYARHSAHVIQILSAGWGETARGRPLEERIRSELLKLPRDVRPLISGPNTVGNRVHDGIDSTFVDGSRSNSDFKTGKRNSAFIVQSGGFLLTRFSDVWPTVLPGVQISVGNQLDLSNPDFLEYFIRDTSITSFGLYIEGLFDGEGVRMINLVRKARSQGQVVIIYKAGSSKNGVRAAFTHTGARAGDAAQFKLLLTQAGAIVTDSTDDWNKYIELTTVYPALLKKRDRPLGVGLVTNCGYEKGGASDQLTADGTEGFVRMTPWSPESRARILEVYKKGGIDKNFDLHEVLDVGPTVGAEIFYDATRAMLSDPNCDVAIVSGWPESARYYTLENELDHPKGIVGYLKKIQEEFPNKLLICSIESGIRYWPFRKRLIEMGIPVFTALDQLSRCLRTILQQVNRR